MNMHLKCILYAVSAKGNMKKSIVRNPAASFIRAPPIRSEKFDLDHSIGVFSGSSINRRRRSGPHHERCTQYRNPSPRNEEIDMQTEVLKVNGLDSEKCVDTIARALSGIDGVSEITVSLLRSQVIVQFDENRAGSGQLQAALERAGYRARPMKAALDEGSCCGGCCS